MSDINQPKRNPDQQAIHVNGDSKQRSTSGMTTKVVKGSIWTLIGQVLPMLVALIATPFTIRFLGSEGYGVLILVGLIPTYFAFADFGMGIASTKFGSEAYGEQDAIKERETVWTAALVATMSATIVAFPMILFSGWIVSELNVPSAYWRQASIALKIASFSFVLGILSSVFNSPMLARLRMDWNTITQAAPKVLLAAITPIILYFGGGIIEAVSWAFIVSIGTLAVAFHFSGRLLPELLRPSINGKLVTPLLKFGGAWFVAVIAGIFIGNLEKLLLTSLVSVRALAYYSIAFTFANLATLLSQAMLQSLLPAFSQMMSPEQHSELNLLFSRCIRLVVAALIPFVVFLFVIGRPFLTLWAGEDFGRESTIPFYLLLCGFSLSIFSVLPYCIILAAGRTDYFAKMYWVELPFYALLAWFLIDRFEIIGAAIAYAIRTVFDGIWAIVLCNRTRRLRYDLGSNAFSYLLGTTVLLPVVIHAIRDNFSPWLFATAILSFAVYGLVAWSKLLNLDEKHWLMSKVRGIYN